MVKDVINKLLEVYNQVSLIEKLDDSLGDYIDDEDREAIEKVIAWLEFIEREI